MKKNNKNGYALLLTLLVMSAILSIAIGLSRLGLGEIRLSRDNSVSLVAYYAAETGVECQMFADRIGGVTCGTAEVPMCLSPDICVETISTGISPGRTIQSTGSYRDVRRAIELTY